MFCPIDIDYENDEEFVLAPTVDYSHVAWIISSLPICSQARTTRLMSFINQPLGPVYRNGACSGLIKYYADENLNCVLQGWTLEMHTLHIGCYDTYQPFEYNKYDEDRLH